MGFTLAEFAELRPYLFHLVNRKNLPVLRATRTLWSAEALAGKSGKTRILRNRREGRKKVKLCEGKIVVRDQAPLSPANVEFEGDWTFEKLLHELNRRVFLWPGTVDGPVPAGRRHASKYADTDVVLRLRTRDVLDQKPEFCKYNSGSPRCTDGRKSPRGPNTFLPAERCPFRASQVVEVTFVRELRLPDTTVWRDSPDGEWEPLLGV